MRHRLLLTLAAIALLTTTIPLLAQGQEHDHGVRLLAFGSEEMAYIRLPGGTFVWPQSEVLGGSRPRVILDFPGINNWNEAYLPTGGGDIIRRIRTYLHNDEARLRVVLDLAEPPQHYALSLSYETDPQGAEITVSAIPLDH
ncbi:MAG: hypothetical protein KKE73_10165 [Proteobacteria bacterium]|nr:hypothetical protein [Pseudomonadota bacterium]